MRLYLILKLDSGLQISVDASKDGTSFPPVIRQQLSGGTCAGEGPFWGSGKLRRCPDGLEGARPVSVGENAVVLVTPTPESKQPRADVLGRDVLVSQ